MEAVNRLREGTRALERQDRRILATLFTLSLAAFALGVIYALITVLGRAGFFAESIPTLHKALTLHGTTAFYYWLYFVQAALLLLLIPVFSDGVNRFHWRPALWIGTALMGAGFLINQYASLFGASVLYGASAPLSGQFPNAKAVYVGYMLLTTGLVLLALAAIRTALEAKRGGREWSSITFAAVMWWGLVLVTALAASNAYLPTLGWLISGGAMSFNYEMKWHVMFHNMHYLPLMSTVLMWYVLAEATTGVKSIYSERLSKSIFAIYLITIPPTSLYHAFLSPGIPEILKVIASILGLLISVPTIMVFLLIVTSLETGARAHGAQGWLGWMRALPWRNPAFSAMAMAMLCAAAGGALSNVLLQHGFANRISDTFFVPAYFHFFTVGTVSLTFLGALACVLPAMKIHGRLWRPNVLVRLPHVLAFGVYLFGSAGVAAGYLGAPRRTFELDYAGAASPMWETLMILVGVGGVIMAAVLLIYAYGLIRTAFTFPSASRPIEELPQPDFRSPEARQYPAWSGLFAMGLLLGAMMILTTLTFRLMTSIGGGG